MPRVLKLILTLIVISGAWISAQLWWKLVVEGSLDENSGVSAIVPVAVWPVGTFCIVFYLLYLIWREF